MNDNFTDLQLYCLDKVAEGRYTFDLTDRKLLNLMPIELKSLIGAEMGLNKNGDNYSEYALKSWNGTTTAKRFHPHVVQ